MLSGGAEICLCARRFEKIGEVKGDVVKSGSRTKGLIA